MIQPCSRFRDKGPLIAETVIKSIRKFKKKPLFLVGKASWINELPSAIRKYNNTIHSSTKTSPIQASKKSNEKEVYSNFEDKREIGKSKYRLGDLVRNSDIRSTFSKGDSTNYSYILYTITEVIQDTIASYRIDYLPERYNKNLKLPTKLSLEENNQVMKESNLFHKNNKKYLALSEEEFIQKNAKHCGHCIRNTLLPYEYEWTCFSCGYNVIKRKHELSKIKKHNIVLNRLKNTEHKNFCICVDV